MPRQQSDGSYEWEMFTLERLGQDPDEKDREICEAWTKRGLKILEYFGKP